MGTHDACTDGKYLVCPPLRALNDRSRHTEFEELLGTFPVEGLTREEWLQELGEVFSLDNLDKEFLGQVIAAVRQVQGDGGTSNAHI